MDPFLAYSSNRYPTIPSTHELTRRGNRTCPDHSFVHTTSEQLITPSGAYVLESLSKLSDGHHILGVAFHVVDGPLSASMAVPKKIIHTSAFHQLDQSRKKT
jgi:hypothetical protein